MHTQSSGPAHLDRSEIPFASRVVWTAGLPDRERSMAHTRFAAPLAAKRPAPGRARRLQFVLVIVGEAARLALALFVTTGFAVGLSLYTGRPLLDPSTHQACTWFLAWCLLLFGFGWRD